MEVRWLANLIRHSGRTVSIYVALALVASLSASLFSTPVYEATATVQVSDATVSPESASYPAQLAGEHLANTYARLITSRETLRHVIDAGHISTTVDRLAKRVSASTVPETQLIQLTVADSSSKGAAAIADALIGDVNARLHSELKAKNNAASLEVQRQMDSVQRDIDAARSQLAGLGGASAEATLRGSLEGRIRHYEATYRDLQRRAVDLQVTFNSSGPGLVGTGAEAPTEPVRPRPLVDAMLAALFGVVLALVVSYLSERADAVVRDGNSAVAAAGSLLLGIVPPRLISHGPIMPSELSDAWTLLRTNIEFAQLDHPCRTLLVTAASPGEGATGVAVNLALAAAQGGARVLLLEGNMRRPGIARALDLQGVPGLFAALAAPPEVSPAGLIEQLSLPVSVITAPCAPIAASAQTGSVRMRLLLNRLAGEYTLVIVDGPSVLEASDAASLADMCDATVLVVAKGVTHKAALLEARKRLSSAGANLLGVVLCDSDADKHAYYPEQEVDRHDMGLRRLLPVRRHA